MKTRREAQAGSAVRPWEVFRAFAVNIKSECRSEKTKKRPIEPVIDNVAAGHWTFKACEIWQDRFVSYGRIIKRKCTGKESVARNPVGMCGMNASEHRHHDQQAPWQHGSTPRSALAPYSTG